MGRSRHLCLDEFRNAHAIIIIPLGPGVDPRLPTIEGPADVAAEEDARALIIEREEVPHVAQAHATLARDDGARRGVRVLQPAPVAF